jgi:hypothetical protein
MRAAKDYGGTRNSGSGNGPWRKNDVRTPCYSIECKVTDKRSFTLKLPELRLAEKYALLDMRIMLWEIRMAGREYVVMTKADFLQEIDARRRLEFI